MLTISSVHQRPLQSLPVPCEQEPGTLFHRWRSSGRGRWQVSPLGSSTAPALSRAQVARPTPLSGLCAPPTVSPPAPVTGSSTPPQPRPGSRLLSSSHPSWPSPCHRKSRAPLLTLALAGTPRTLVKSSLTLLVTPACSDSSACQPLRNRLGTQPHGPQPILQRPPAHCRLSLRSVSCVATQLSGFFSCFAAKHRVTGRQSLSPKSCTTAPGDGAGAARTSSSPTAEPGPCHSHDLCASPERPGASAGHLWGPVMRR